MPLQNSSVEYVKTLLSQWEKKRNLLEKKSTVKSQISFEQMQTIARYLDFLSLNDAEKKLAAERLFESSTQFLFCKDLEGLGDAVQVNEKLDINYFFTNQWYKTKKTLIEAGEAKVPEKASLSGELAKLLEQDWTRVSMAIYGIDGLGEADKQTKSQNYSMLPVMKAIKKHTDIRAVVDVENYKQNPANVRFNFNIHLRVSFVKV